MATDFTPLDRQRLGEALALAENSIGLSDPNPRVGCILGREDGTVLGRGFTQRAGEAHAEVMALRDAAAQGADLRGATAWVTLEPCSHHGRTGPCCEALIAAGLGRVVVSMEDPNPQVHGQGIARLRAAGIEVVMAPDDLATAARELNIGFVSRMTRGRPWVRMKVAASLDGRTALPDGTSQWITGPEARVETHRWRKRAGAIVTGIGTVLRDDPQMTVREVPTASQPLRVVVDSCWRTPLSARILLGAPIDVLIVGADADGPGRHALEAAGVRCVALASAEGRVDVPRLVDELGRRGVNEVHLEAGAALNGSTLDAGLVDELLVFVAPRLLGDGAGLAAGILPEALSRPPRFVFHAVERVGRDLLLALRRPGS